MNVHENGIPPAGLGGGWSMSTQEHRKDEVFGLHYHSVEEWLQVRTGRITFLAGSGKEYRVSEGQALQIPQGEVHRVEVGPEGVTYNMWVPEDEGEGPFRKDLDDVKYLIEDNLKVPDKENGKDDAFREFFEPFLSRSLTFRSAKGQVFTRDQFLGRKRSGVRRSPDDAVRILRLDDEMLLLATTIYTEPDGGGPRSAVSNHRLFVREDGAWKCRIWLNFPEPAAS